MPKRIVISGYYGYGNTGDEAVLAGILATFRQLNLDAEVTVLSGDPSRTASEHPGVRALHRYRQLLSAVRGADLVISGGGSLLQDATSARSIYYYLFVLRLARMLGKPTMVYAQGIGPLIRPGARKWTAGILNRMKAITVRDSDSKALLESIGVRMPVTVTADPAFLVEPDQDEARNALDGHGLARQEFILASVRPWQDNSDWPERFGRGLREASEQLGVPIAVLPMQESEDLALSEEISAGTLIRGVSRVPTVKGLIGRASLVVGMRLHALIFAASEGVPFVPVAYDPKVASFAAMTGQPSLDVTTLDADALSAAIVSAWNERAERRAHLARCAEQMKRQALESGRIAADLLSGKRV